MLRGKAIASRRKCAVTMMRRMGIGPRYRGPNTMRSTVCVAVLN